MTIIANPLYDTVFKYLMEDDRAAKVLLSALLKKEVKELTMRQNEYTNLQQTRISLFRIDFSAKLKDASGKEELVLIELQKTWLATETLRFRQYLGTQYLDEDNVPEGDNPKGFGLPIISIYILGHKLGDLKQPVVYVRRKYLDYDDHLIEDGVPDPFIESLTHDSVIVQIPYLKGRARNHLERILTVFDQEYRLPGDVHLLSIDEDGMHADERLLVNRLVRAAISPEIRRHMQVEDEILSEIEKRDTDIMQREQELKEKEQVLEQKDQELEQKNQELEQKEQALKEKNQALEQTAQVIDQKNQELEQKDQALEQKDQKLEQKNQELEQKEQALKEKNQVLEQTAQVVEQQSKILRATVGNLSARGMTPAEIAGILSISEEEIRDLLEEPGVQEES